MLPFVLRRFGVDLATSAAPFVATIVDVFDPISHFTAAAVSMRGTLLWPKATADGNSIPKQETGCIAR